MTEITMLNSMAGRDFAASLAQHHAWGLRLLDLKDAIFDQALLDLTDAQAHDAARLIAAHDLRVYCFSTVLFHEDVDRGPDAFAAALAGKIERTIALARILHPQVIRLLAARSASRPAIPDGPAHIRSHCPWLIDLYRHAIDALTAAGLPVTIENECHGCLLASPQETVAFFADLDRPGKVSFTWDVQNMWQMGAFPTLAAYHILKPLIGYYHLKGGQSDPAQGDRLVWRSSLESASWPVAEITRRVIADAVSPVICLNPSHGKPRPGEPADYTPQDLAYLQNLIAAATA